MKPGPFTYHAPTTVDEVLDLLAAHGDEAKPLAGGQSLVPMLALRLAHFPHLVDLNRVAELVGVTRTDGTLRIGAMTRQADVEHDEVVAASVPLLARALPLIGHFQIRNRGTVGGSIAHADPAAELPAVLLALDGTVEVRSADESRTVTAAALFTGLWATALDPAEIVVAVTFPACRPGEGFAVEEVARRHGDFALVGAACRVRSDDDGRVAEAAIALFGVAPTPVRVAEAEAAAAGLRAADDPVDVGAAVARAIHPTDDVHATADYRRSVAGVVVRRALVRAMQEANRG